MLPRDDCHAKKDAISTRRKIVHLSLTVSDAIISSCIKGILSWTLRLGDYHCSNCLRLALLGSLALADLPTLAFSFLTLALSLFESPRAVHIFVCFDEDLVGRRCHQQLIGIPKEQGTPRVSLLLLLFCRGVDVASCGACPSPRGAPPPPRVDSGPSLFRHGLVRGNRPRHLFRQRRRLARTTTRRRPP